MSKHELLVPAGDMESLKQAIANGADAIYLGCKSFGARKFAKNFEKDEIVEAIKEAHLFGVKIYVTMNTLIKDKEVDSFLEQVDFLHKNGVDAIIMQDFGMICLVREKYPNLEVHASTQANTSSKETAELFYKLGVKRVVFSREMTLEEIESIDVPIEKEVFIHGALCICYSGCCLMSSMLGTRSGNRGECAGSCRLPYSLEKSGNIITANKYLLSTKELNSTPKIKELLNSNITSFKIEGRMKSPEYVGFITRYYRNLIDNENETDLEEQTDKLKTIFNREFTIGNLFSTSPKELMNQNSPNHIGLEIGRVVAVNPTKIKIKLTKPLNQHDGIRFLNSKKGFIVNYLYDENNNLISNATDICYVDNKVNLTKDDIVCKTQDYKLLTNLKVLPERKIPVSFKVYACIDKPLEIVISDGVHTITATGTKVMKAINAPISKERIEEQLEKLGETPFLSNSVQITSDPLIFISIKELNDLRRELSKKLEETRKNVKKDYLVNEVKFNPVDHKSEKTLTASAFTEEQLATCLELNIKKIYVESKPLYEKYKHNKNVILKLPRCSITPSTLQSEKNLVSDYFNFSPQNIYHGDYPLNVTNIYTVYYLHKLNVKTITLSVELEEDEIINLFNTYREKFKTIPNLEVIAYGRVENMLIKGNILSLAENKYDYALVDIKKRYFPVFYDGINTHILNYENKKLKSTNILSKIASPRLIFFDEEKSEIKKIVNSFQ